jgi:hypothetical protein
MPAGDLADEPFCLGLVPAVLGAGDAGRRPVLGDLLPDGTGGVGADRRHVHELSHAGGCGGPRHAEGSLDVHPAEVVRSAAGLQRPGQVDHGVDAVEEAGEHLLARRLAEIGQVPPDAGVRLDVRRLPAGEPAHLGDAGGRCGEPAEERGADVAGCAGDGDGEPVEVAGGEVGHEEALPDPLAPNRPAGTGKSAERQAALRHRLAEHRDRLGPDSVDAEEVGLGQAVELGEIGVPGIQQRAGRRPADAAGEAVGFGHADDDAGVSRARDGCRRRYPARP